MNGYKNPITISIEQNKNKKSNKSPFKHQLTVIDKMNDFYKEKGKRGILVLPTGSGKTYTAVYWLIKNIINKKKRIIWLADQGFLLEQAFNEFKRNIPEINPNLRKELRMILVSGNTNHANSNRISRVDDIIFMTSQTAISNWKIENNRPSLFRKFIIENAQTDDLFIVYDEAHHTPAYGRRNLLIGTKEDNKGIITIFPNISMLGLTATPTYTDKNQRNWLWRIFKDEIIDDTITQQKLEKERILAVPDYQQEKTNFSFEISEKEVEQVVYQHREIPQKIIEEIAKNEERNEYIADFYLKNKEKFGKTIIFLDRWYQCKHVEKKINKKAGKNIAASVFSYIDSNKNIDYINNRAADQNTINLERFKNNEIEVLLNVKMLTEGVDVPDVKTVFITRDTNSYIRFKQMEGRALRGEKAGGKKNRANIVLFSDNWSKHILLASHKFKGEAIDEEIKERGYNPYELISIDLIDKIEFEYSNQNFNTPIINFMPIGWYEVVYSDTIEEDREKITESFKENVLINKHEENQFINFINDFLNNKIKKTEDWEKEEIEIEKLEKEIYKFIDIYFKDVKEKNVLKLKLLQIGRHIGQNNTYPNFYTFKQREDLDLRKLVKHVIEKDYRKSEIKKFVQEQYDNTIENPLFKSVFPTFESFRRAYKYEEEVYERMGEDNNIVSEEHKSTVKRLVDSELRKRIFSRDGNKCLCCGKTNNLQSDHIVAYKYEEPKNDDINLYQTLCKTCNNEKGVNDFNYRNLSYKKEKFKVRNVLQSSSKEDPKYYLTRLINSYFATSAVHKDKVHAINNGNAIWKVIIKYGSDININPLEYILKDKHEIIKILKNRGYRFKDLEITIG